MVMSFACSQAHTSHVWIICCQSYSDVSWHNIGDFTVGGDGVSGDEAGGGGRRRDKGQNYVGGCKTLWWVALGVPKSELPG